MWQLRHWLQFLQLRTLIHDNLCYLTIKSDSGQHSQFLRCFDNFPLLVSRQIWLDTFFYSKSLSNTNLYSIWTPFLRLKGKACLLWSIFEFYYYRFWFHTNGFYYVKLRLSKEEPTYVSFDRTIMLRTSSIVKKPFQQKPQSLVRPLRLFEVVGNKSFILEHILKICFKHQFPTNFKSNWKPNIQGMLQKSHFLTNNFISFYSSKFENQQRMGSLKVTL